ncbi:EDSAP-1 family PEP-CTERM protein [Pseudoduganella sp. GCM10020061]|uniref:EDSAP-1 family PEP-CTERM protein n=1 Tax=Pseudoduganella sp. GCM10020061 TaxID=3317345 RepID=UPI003639A698
MRHPVRFIPALLLCVGATLPLAAYADVRSTAIIDVSQLRILRSDGTPFTTSDFAQVSVMNQGNVFYHTGDSTEFDIVSPTTGAVDVGLACAGAPCPVTSENDFSPLSASPGGYFSNVDQRQTGSLLAGDLHWQARSDSSAGSTADGFWGGDSESGVSLQFQLNEAGTMTVSFDATPFVELSRPVAASSPGEQGSAGTFLRITIADLTNNQNVLFIEPEALTDAARLQFSSDSQVGDLIYDPDTMSFSFTSGVLSPNNTYELFISASAGTFISAVPEPSSLAMFSAGMASLLLLRRRRAGRPQPAADRRKS